MKRYIHPKGAFITSRSYFSVPDSISSISSFIYKLFTAQDANMKCTRLNASSEQRDPGFNNGHAYFVDQPQFMAHVQEFDKKIPDTKSTCNDHKAVRNANSRREKNLTARGVASIFCARHDCFRPGSTCDLRYGERYVVSLTVVSPNADSSLVK